MSFVNALQGFNVDNVGPLAITTCTSVATANSNTTSITLPSGIQKGDLIVVGAHVIGSGSVFTYNTPAAGWASVGRQSGLTGTTPFYQEMFLKIADGNESGASFSSPITGGTNTWMVCSLFRPNTPITAYAQKRNVSTSSVNDPADITIPGAGAGGSPVPATCQLQLGLYGSSAAISPRVWSTTADGEVATSGQETYMAWKFYPSSPADTTFGMDDEGTHNLLTAAVVELYAGEADALTTLGMVGQAFVSSGTSITAPGDIRRGDLIVMFDWSEGGSAPAAAVPSGFTQAATATLSTARCTLSYKLADGSESGASLSGMTGATTNTKYVWVFRGNREIRTVSGSAQDPDLVGGTAAPTGQTLTASGGTAPNVSFAFWFESTGVGTPGAITFTIGGNPNTDNIFGPVALSAIPRVALIGVRLQTSSPADVSVGMADSGTNWMGSFYLNLT